jgi:enamine deaminase RidA (YjgF/YER057c/UK114 family)
MERRHVSSGTEWESRVGYSRAIRAGNTVHVAGTTATDDDGEIIAPGEPRAQTEAALEIVSEALEEAGASLTDVVRTSLYVTDIDDWEAVGEVHGEVFGDVRPAATMVEVSSLIDEDAVVEIEVEAIVSE